MNINDFGKTVEAIGASLRQRRPRLEQAMTAPALFLVLIGAVAVGTITALTCRFGATLATMVNQPSNGN